MRDEAAALGFLALGLFGIAKQRQQAKEADAVTSLLFSLGGIGASASCGFLIPFVITLLLVRVSPSEAEGVFSTNFFAGNLLGSVFYYFGFIVSVSFFIVSTVAVVLFSYYAQERNCRTGFCNFTEIRNSAQCGGTCTQ
jgi:uncharacterized membrane protein